MALLTEAQPKGWEREWGCGSWTNNTKMFHEMKQNINKSPKQMWTRGGDVCLVWVDEIDSCYTAQAGLGDPPASLSLLSARIAPH